jgi:hypothetical protein
VWALLGVAEWVMAVLSQVMRECVQQTGRMEWEGGDAALWRRSIVMQKHIAPD